MKDIQKDIIDKLTPEAIEDMQHIFFVADLHFDHPKIVRICNRPVPLTENLDIAIPEQKKRLNELHNDWLIREVYNKYIDRKDEVYILGDVSLYPKNDAEKIIDRLHGNKHLIVGNHDGNIAHSTRFCEITQRKDFRYKRFGLDLEIILDHYPIVSWKNKIHGSFMLYGHVHGRLGNLPLEIEKFLGFIWDVGIDNKKTWEDLEGKECSNWCKPVNLYEVIQIMTWKAKSLGKGIDGEYNIE